MRYPLIEAATAGLFAGVAARIGFSWSLPAYLVLAAGLLALACTDMEHLLLPKTNRLSGPRYWSAPSWCWRRRSPTTGTISCGRHQRAVVWFAIFFAMNFISPRALGFGDVRLAPVLGLALGWLGCATSCSASSPPT